MSYYPIFPTEVLIIRMNQKNCSTGEKRPIDFLTGIEGSKTMPQSIMAVYEHGFLRPLEPLTLPEKHKIRIQIIPEPAIDNEDDIIQFLVKMGVITPPSNPSNPSLISKADRRKLADALAKNAKQTLSEIVIEDRGQWYPPIFWTQVRLSKNT